MKVSSSSILSLALALNGALASPLRARDYQVVTVTEVATQVVHITSTTWVDPAQYNPTELSTPPPTTDSNEKHKHKSYVTTSTPSVSISETLASPTVSSSISELSVVPSSTLAYSPVETTQQTTLSTTTPSTSIPTTTTASLPTTTSIPTTTIPPTTLETSILPVPTTSISVPPVVQSTTAPAPAPTLGGNTPSTPGGGTTYSGQATFYNTGLGSCGITSSDSDFICAIAAPRYDAQGTANPNNNPLCGKKINVSYNGGKPVTVTIVDRCPECAENNLDLSPAAFNAMGATPDQGRVNVAWSFA